MKYANLHLHSVYSDGIHTPRELCAMAAEQGYRAIALTDHETNVGNAKMHEAAKEFGLECLNGIETYVQLGDKASYHMVGLGFDPDHPRMRAYTDWTERIAEDLTIRRVDYCLKNGIFSGITWNDIVDRFPDVKWYCNEQVFKVLQEKQGVTDPEYWAFVKQFNHIPLPKESTSVEAAEMIDIIRSAGGIAIVAHPGAKQLEYLPELAALGLGGVEVDHPDMTEANMAEAARLANELGLCPSGGTDHTGALGNSTKRGPLPGKTYPRIPEHLEAFCGATKEEFEEIKARVSEG